MGDISTHFNRYEFKCSCCDFDTVDVDLLEILEDAREYFDGSIMINSAARCSKHNTAIGSDESSQHRLGRAADIVVEGRTPEAVATYFENKYPDKFGIGRYQTFCHIDSRSTKSRWSA